MAQFKLRAVRILLLLAGFMMPLSGENFVAPAEGPLAFRRDKLPLDAATMAQLAQGLVALIETLDWENPRQRRGAAQLLALAIALDPASPQARALLEEITAGRHLPTEETAIDSEKLEKLKRQIWQAIDWLETPSAGLQGQALASCLKDMMVLVDPENPRLAALQALGEQGAWVGWIPPVAAYETEKIPDSPEPPPPEPPAAGLPLAEATVSALTWISESDSEQAQKTWEKGSLRMSATKADEEAATKPFSLTIGSPEAMDDSVDLVSKILKLLRKQHGELPTGLRVTLEGDGLDALILAEEYSSVDAACAVLASAAVTGRELGEVTILGKMDAAGGFKLSDDFWMQLQVLGPGEGHRLVLPLAAAEYLTSLLAIERPGLLMEYEVLLAADFKELLDLTAKNPPTNVSKISTQFTEIRKKGISQPLAQYIANPFVRRRLAEISQEAPFHYSAKLLGMQGAGNRTTFVCRPVLKAELRKAIQPMEWLLEFEAYDLEPEQTDKFNTVYQTSRDRIETFFRYAEKTDRELVIKVQRMVTDIRSLDRAAKSRGYPYEISSAIDDAQDILKKSYKETIKILESIEQPPK